MDLYDELYATLLCSVLGLISSVDTNLYTITTTLLFTRWYFYRECTLLHQLVYLYLYIEVLNFENFFFKINTYKQVNLNLLNGLFFFHPIVLVILLIFLILIVKKKIVGEKISS